MLESGFISSICFYFFALSGGLVILRPYRQINKNIVIVVMLPVFLHFVSSYLYTFISTDSYNQFFLFANNNRVGYGTQFVKFLTWYVRYYLSGDSYLATLWFFSAFSYLGSILWYCLYLDSCKLLQIERRSSRIFPALILLCWPSFLFFTSGIGKDSLSFFLIPLILLMWVQLYYKKKNKVFRIAILIAAMCLLTLIRPYLLMIFLVAYYLSSLKGLKYIKISQIVILIVMAPIILYVVNRVVAEQAHMEEVTIENIAEKSLINQTRQDKGTSFPILSQNPYINFLCLPYSFLMNLIMPLFILARNIQGMVSSVENAFLLWLIYKFWKSRHLFRSLRKKHQFIKLYYNFFIVGMSFMALINTNLGLAVRQKSMYLPPLLIIMMLVWTHKKQEATNDNLNYRKLRPLHT